MCSLLSSANWGFPISSLKKTWWIRLLKAKKKKSNNLNIVKRKEKKRNESTIPILNEFMLQNVTSHLWWASYSSQSGEYIKPQLFNISSRCWVWIWVFLDLNASTSNLSCNAIKGTDLTVLHEAWTLSHPCWVSPLLHTLYIGSVMTTYFLSDRHDMFQYFGCLSLH